MNKILSTCVTFLLMAGCNKQAPHHKLASGDTEPDTITEVNNLPLILRLLKTKLAPERERYTNNKNKIFPMNGFSQLYKTMGSNSKKSTIYLNGENKLLLLLDLYEIDKDIHTNVPSKLTPYKEYIGIEINVKDIKNNVIIYDKNNNVLFTYEIK